MLKLRIISDIHLELSKNPAEIIKKCTSIDIDADVLILAGDIGNPFEESYITFLQEMALEHKLVLLVTGNHEYYQPRASYYDVNEKIKEVISNIENVKFLDREIVEYRGVSFLGCTLWTESDSNAPWLMNDYSKIENFTPSLCNLLHARDKEWLENNLNFKDRTVVITHHLPSYQLIADKYKGNIYHNSNKYFATDLEYLLEKANIWVAGHTHTAVIKEINGCKCYVNPVGYGNEDTGFIEDLVIEI